MFAYATIGYLNHHKLTYPNKSQLLESVNNYMTAFAEKEASEARSRARQRQEPDADGFITVTRGGRTNPARQEVAQEQAEKQKEKDRGLEDFYRFQSREKRKQRASELVRKFEEDKEKIRKMRERSGTFRVRVYINLLHTSPQNADGEYSPNKPSPAYFMQRVTIISVYGTTSPEMKHDRLHWSTVSNMVLRQRNPTL